ncbi:MAG: hypothetical protein J5I90_21845 [Caldilineales bacterium]|nr:hypothetical protein [Caldilineales bacterium]
MPDLNINPAVIFILILTLIYGTLFHIVRGRGWVDLLLSLVMALVGMILGQIIGTLLGLNLLRIGQVYVLEGTILAWLLMLAAAWLKG